MADTGSINIGNEIRGMLSVKLGVEPAGIAAGTTLREDLGLDSFQAVELVYELELKYKLKVPTEDMKNFKKVGDIEDYLSIRLGR